jgi:hypothetical protein
MTDPVTPPVDPTPPAADTPPPAAPPADLSPEELARVQAIDTPPAEPAATPEPTPAQARIEELAAQNKREREYMTEYAEFWRQQALKGAAPPPAEPAAPAADPAPSLDAFDSTEKWAAAQTAWMQREIKRQAAVVANETLSADRATTAEQATRTAYLERLAAFEKDTPNARVTIANPVFSAQLQRQPVIADVVMASEHGPAVALHLATNPIEADRISRLPPVQAAHALGRIEAAVIAKRAAPPAPPKPKPTGAPPPPTPISGNGSPVVDLNNCSLSEYVKIRGEQRRARDRGGR